MYPRIHQASMLLQQDRFIEAETLLRAAIAEGADTAEAHAMLAVCLRRAGVHDEANKEIQAALALDPNCAYAHYVLSFPSVSTGQRGARFLPKSCIKAILRALELAPNHVGYLARLAELRQQAHQWKASLEPLETALRLAPRDVGLVVQRAEALTHLGRREEARASLLQALEADPEAASAHAGMGWALLRTGDYQRATEFFEEALRLRPELSWAQRGALECAKHQYRLYRVLAWPAERFVHRPLLRFGIEMGVCIAILLAALATLFWLDPVIRPRWGGGPIVAIFLPLIVIPILLQFGKEPFFSWLVRHHRAAQLSTTAPIVRENSTKWVGGIFVGCLTVAFASLLGYSKSPAIFGLLGLVPGLAALGVALFDVPADPWRKWLIVFSAIVLAGGPVLMIAGRKFILDLDPDPRSSILLCVPAIVIALISQRIKQKQLVQRHKQMLATSSKKILSK